VSVNPVSGSTTVVFEAAKSSLSELRAVVQDGGFHCSGETLPRHVCDGHALPDFRLAKALLKNFRFETAIPDAKELLTEKRCYSVAAECHRPGVAPRHTGGMHHVEAFCAVTAIKSL
jgi:hypothetical protein